jgi:hypothetical protein
MDAGFGSVIYNQTGRCFVRVVLIVPLLSSFCDVRQRRGILSYPRHR